MDRSEDDCFSHPSEETLELYALKRLPGDQVAPVEDHLLLCPQCQEALAESEEFVSLMRAALREPVARSARTAVPRWASGTIARFPRLHVPPRAAWGLALAVVCLLAVSVPWRSALAPDPARDPAPVMLSSFRGSQAMSTAHGPARTPLDLGIEAAYLQAGEDCRIEIVHADGSPAWNGQAVPADTGELHARVPGRLSAGTYWVRLYRAGSELVQEFGLELD